MSGKDENKVYYWMAQKEDFYNTPAMDVLFDQEDGFAYVTLYSQLCLLTINSQGYLVSKIGKTIYPYTAKKIARATKYYSEEFVKKALNLYIDLELIMIGINGYKYIPEVQQSIGSSSNDKSAKQKAKSGAKKRAEKNVNDFFEISSNKEIFSNNGIDDESIQERKEIPQSNGEKFCEVEENDSEEVRKEIPQSNGEKFCEVEENDSEEVRKEIPQGNGEKFRKVVKKNSEEVRKEIPQGNGEKFREVVENNSEEVRKEIPQGNGEKFREVTENNSEEVRKEIPQGSGKKFREVVENNSEEVRKEIPPQYTDYSIQITDNRNTIIDDVDLKNDQNLIHLSVERDAEDSLKKCNSKNAKELLNALASPKTNWDTIIPVEYIRECEAYTTPEIADKEYMLLKKVKNSFNKRDSKTINLATSEQVYSILDAVKAVVTGEMETPVMNQSGYIANCFRNTFRL